MFRFFRPRLPLSTFSRVDLELLMRRNIDVIGREHVLSAEVLTDVSQLGLDASSPEGLVRSASAEVSRRMRVPQSGMEVAIEQGSDFDAATRYVAGTTDAPARLLIRREVTEDPMRTVVELAYGYAHHFWLLHPAPRPLDTHPRTTHLMPVCMGLGVLASTTALKESHWSASGYSGWSMSRSGYYSPLEIGYALALWARARSEVDPQWLSFLRLDSRRVARDAAKYFMLHQAGGGQRLFDAVSIPGTDRSPLELVRWLAGADPDFAMAAAYALAKLEHLPDAAVDAALARTYGNDPEMVVLATR